MPRITTTWYMQPDGAPPALAQSEALRQAAAQAQDEHVALAMRVRPYGSRWTSREELSVAEARRSAHIARLSRRYREYVKYISHIDDRCFTGRVDSPTLASAAKANASFNDEEHSALNDMAMLRYPSTVELQLLAARNGRTVAHELAADEIPGMRKLVLREILDAIRLYNTFGTQSGVGAALISGIDEMGVHSWSDEEKSLLAEVAWSAIKLHIESDRNDRKNALTSLTPFVHGVSALVGREKSQRVCFEASQSLNGLRLHYFQSVCQQVERAQQADVLLLDTKSAQHNERTAVHTYLDRIIDTIYNTGYDENEAGLLIKNIFDETLDHKPCKW